MPIALALVAFLTQLLGNAQIVSRILGTAAAEGREPTDAELQPIHDALKASNEELNAALAAAQGNTPKNA